MAVSELTPEEVDFRLNTVYLTGLWFALVALVGAVQLAVQVWSNPDVTPYQFAMIGIAIVSIAWAGIWSISAQFQHAFVSFKIRFAYSGRRLLLRLPSGSTNLKLSELKKRRDADIVKADERYAQQEADNVARRSTLYHVYIGVGVVGILTMVTFTSGPFLSPFSPLLVGTFVLGQIRAPTTRSVWALFALGIVAVGTGQFIYQLSSEDWMPSSFDDVRHSALTYVAPALLIALMTSIVNHTLVEERAKEMASSSPSLQNSTESARRDESDD